jgi:hypothetical protein
MGIREVENLIYWIVKAIVGLFLRSIFTFNGSNRTEVNLGTSSSRILMRDFALMKI